MSGPSSLRLSDLPVELLHHIARSLPISTISCLLRTSRFFHDVFCDEIYRLAANSGASRNYLYQCAIMLFRGNTNALRRFIDNCTDKAVISVSSPGDRFCYGNALQVVALMGDEAMARLLVDNGADVNAHGGPYGYALQAAAEGGHEAVTQLLLNSGAAVNARGGFYGHALQAAAWNGHEAVVRLLLNSGAVVNARGGEYSTALEAAARRGHEAVTRLLLNNGADVGIRYRFDPIVCGSNAVARLLPSYCR